MLKRFILMTGLLFLFYSYQFAGMDAQVIIRETILDNFLSAVGPIGKTEKFSVAGIKGSYTWSIQNPRIEISTDKARFIADASVKVMSFKYDTTAYGDVEVKYDPAANRISVKILKAAVLIYANLFGKKLNITEIDVSKFYRMQFEFAGPQPIQTKVDVTLPDGKIRTVFVTISPQMRLEPHQITVGSSLQFKGQDK